MPGKALVVNANILVRAVLGKRVRCVIEAYAGQVSFFVPALLRRRFVGREPCVPKNWGRGRLRVCATVADRPTDFFGCGVPTWTSSRVEMFLRDPHK